MKKVRVIGVAGAGNRYFGSPLRAAIRAFSLSPSFPTRPSQMSVHPAKVDNVADLLTRRPAGESSSSSSRSRAHAHQGHRAVADHVAPILHSVPPDKLKDREAFGINSVNHKRVIAQVRWMVAKDERRGQNGTRN